MMFLPDKGRNMRLLLLFVTPEVAEKTPVLNHNITLYYTHHHHLNAIISAYFVL